MAAKGWTKADRELARHIGQYHSDPLGFVLFAFPWGQPGTALEHSPYKEGPDTWQLEILEYLGWHLRKKPDSNIRIAVTSGHGSGKSALMSWLNLWHQSTRKDGLGINTANTQTQLTTKLWRELAIWTKLSVNRKWFDWQARSLKCLFNPSVWVSDAIPWSETNPDAFAGAHRDNVLICFDEASGIARVICETVQGALTTKAIWIMFGNPTKSSGFFYDAFHEMKHRWYTKHVDTRSCRMTNKEEIQNWIEDYGEDSDFVRVRVRGLFPRVGSIQMIPTELVDRAMQNRGAARDYGVGTAMGVDVARFGDDNSVICFREGNIVHPMHVYHGLDTMELAAEVARKYDMADPDILCVDGNGIGAGVVDRLRQMRFPVVDVQVGQAAEDREKYHRIRTELWGRMQEWFRGDVQLPPDRQLRKELIQQEYGFNLSEQLQLVSKDQMKRDGLESPDQADALALTFAQPVFSREAQRRRSVLGRGRVSSDWRYQ